MRRKKKESKFNKINIINIINFTGKVKYNSKKLYDDYNSDINVI